MLGVNLLGFDFLTRYLQQAAASRSSVKPQDHGVVGGIALRLDEPVEESSSVAGVDGMVSGVLGEVDGVHETWKLGDEISAWVREGHGAQNAEEGDKGEKSHERLHRL